MKIKYIIIIFFFTIINCGFSQQVKMLISYVTDEVGVIQESDRNILENKLKEFEKQTSTQIVVYVINSLEGESLEDLSHRIAETNKIGQKEKNNGVLLFIVIADRKLRIEVGYGLEGALTDALSNQIIRKEITPYFKQKDYYKGINAGIDAIIGSTKGEYLAENSSTQKENSKSDWWIVVIILGLSIGFPMLIILFALKRSANRYNYKSNWSSGSATGSLISNNYSYSYSNYSSNDNSSYSSDNSSSNSDSSSSDSFSGGGGSFGGGGSSGSW